MDDSKKSLIAAVLAVRNGKLTPDQAAELLASRHDDGEALRRFNEALKDGGPDAGVSVSPSLVDVVSENIDNDGELEKLGLDDTTRRTLSQIRGLRRDGTEVKHTLLAISPTRMVRDVDADDMEVIDGADYSFPSSETSRPTIRPKDDVTTRKPSSQILRAVPRKERYDVLQEHARGGMGRILLARDNVIGREVALKELLPGMMPSETTGSVPANTEVSHGITERFLREAKVTGQLEHPNIVSVYEIGKNDDGSLYYTMKFVRGQTLSDRLNTIAKDKTLDKKGKFTARVKLLDNFVDVCNAIAYAHSKGVVHRDLKPENVMIGEYGETIVLDWGLARVKGQEDTVAAKLIDSTRYMSRSVVENETNKLTLDGSIVGTPAYMSPEQARGDLDDIDEQSDVYALGAVLYEMLSGRAPFAGPAAGLIIQQVLQGTPLRMSAVAPDVPPELEALVDHAMAKEKSERLGNAREFADEIKAFRDGRSLSNYNYSLREHVTRWVSRHKKSVVAAMIILYLVVAGGVYHYVQLRNEKELVEQQKQEAEAQRKNADLATRSALIAERDARFEKEKAVEAQANAEEAMRTAKLEASAKEKALQGWNGTLSDAYAMRVRLAVANKDYNSALAFAGAALKLDEQAEARGTMLSLPEVFPLLYHLKPDSPSVQEVFHHYNVEYSPDGRFIVSGHSDGNVRIWSARDGRLRQTLATGRTKVAAVAFTPSGERLLTGSWDGGIDLYELDRDEDIFKPSSLTFQAPERANFRVTALRVSPDGNSFAATLETTYIWDLRTGKIIRKFDKAGDHEPLILSWRPDGRTILTTSPHFNDPFVRIWDVTTGEMKRALIDTSGVNETFTVWSPDGSLIASSSLQGLIRIRDASDFRVKRTLMAHTSTVLGLDFSSDGSLMLSSSLDGTVRLWDTSDFSVRATLKGDGGIVESVTFAPDGRSFSVRNVHGNIRTWALGDGDTQTLHEHTSDVIEVAYSPDGTRFASASWDGSVVVWDTKTKRPIKKFSVPLRQFFAVDFLDGARRILAGGSDGVRVWDIESGTQVAHVIKNEIVTAVDASADQSSFVATHYRQASRFDATTFRKLGEYGTHTQLCVSVAMSPKGDEVATGGYDGAVIVWDAESRKARRVLQEGHGGIYALAYDIKGARVAAGGEDGVVRVYNVADGMLLREYRGHEGIVFSLAFSPDGKYLFSGSQDRAIRVWDLQTDGALAVLKGHSESVTRLSISPDGKVLLSASQDDNIRFWPLRSLFLPRERIVEIAAEITGMTVDDKRFVARMLENWPGEKPLGTNLKQKRRRQSNRIGRFQRNFERNFEGYRYIHRTVDGHDVRTYLPARTTDADGNPVGKPEGRVNYAWYRANAHPGLARPDSGAPVITKVVAGGQGEPLSLKAGDLLWKIAGKRVENRDDLRDVLNEIGDKDFVVTIRRYSRDADGRALPATDNQGNFLLNEQAQTYFAPEEFEVTLKPGKLGLRIANGTIPIKPLR